MAFNSHIQKPARVTEEATAVNNSRYGSPFRFRKPLTLGSCHHEMASKDTLTFLSPQRVISTRRTIISGSPIICGLPKFAPVTGNLDISSQLLETDTYMLPFGKSPSFDSTPQMIPCEMSKDNMVTSEHPNSKLNLLSLEKRGTKRKCVNINYRNDVADDIVTFRTYFPRSEKKYKKLVVNYHHSLQDLYFMIDHVQEEMYKLQEKDWNHKRKFWVEQCNNSLWKVLKCPDLLESTSSEMFPNALIPINKLTSVDKHWLRVLINSAHVECIKCPEFKELIRDPRDPKTKQDGFDFRMKFQFGFDTKNIAWYVHCAIGNIGINHYLCGVVADYVGYCKFFCDIQIYYKISGTP